MFSYFNIHFLEKGVKVRVVFGEIVKPYIRRFKIRK